MLALVCCRNTNNVHCSGTIFPNENFAFASFCVTHLCNPTNREVDQLSNVTVSAARLIPMGSNQTPALQLWIRERTWYLYTRGVRRRMNATECRWFKWLWHEWFHHVRRHVPDGHSIAEILTTIIWRLNSFTVYFRGGVRLRELASVNRITWLRNRHVSDLKIMAKWRDIIFDVLIRWNPMIQIELHNLK